MSSWLRGISATRLNTAVSTRRWTHSYDYLLESKRWRLVAKEADEDKAEQGDGVVVPLTESDWELFRQEVDPVIADWLQQGSVLSIPEVWREELSRHLKIPIDDGAKKKLLIVRLPEEKPSSEGGFRTTGSDVLSLLRSNLQKQPHDTSYTLHLPPNSVLDRARIGFDCVLDSYRFDRYKSNRSSSSKIRVLPPDDDDDDETLSKEAKAQLDATFWVQDLISTPACDLTPGALQRAAESWVAQHQPQVTVQTVIGEDLLSFNGPIQDSNHGCGMIYAVGKAVGSDEEDRLPRLIHIKYEPKAPTRRRGKIHLIGKGVTYDTGGLNLKPGKSMLYMKKDMGGAAHALGLMRCLVECDFPISLELWLPTVENVLGGQSFRPGDVLTGVTGKTTEVGNTDAEGRLILSDALAMASSRPPSSSDEEETLAILDFATLTGAARVALGPDMPAVFTTHPDVVMDELLDAAKSERDPLWHMPLWKGYKPMLDSKIADLNNVSTTGFAGAITAALYLHEFIQNDEIPWIHMDLYGIDDATKAGKAQGLRAMNRFLWNHFVRGERE